MNQIHFYLRHSWNFEETSFQIAQEVVSQRLVILRLSTRKCLDFLGIYRYLKKQCQADSAIFAKKFKF